VTSQADSAHCLTLRPIQINERDGMAHPRIPTEIVVTPAEVFALHEETETAYETMEDLAEAYWLSAAEILGADLTDESLRALRAESMICGDSDAAKVCDQAIAGDAAAREACAESILEAKIAALD
jgi:hypothetical protein